MWGSWFQRKRESSGSMELPPPPPPRVQVAMCAVKLEWLIDQHQTKGISWDGMHSAQAIRGDRVGLPQRNRNSRNDEGLFVMPTGKGVLNKRHAGFKVGVSLHSGCTTLSFTVKPKQTNRPRRCSHVGWGTASPRTRVVFKCAPIRDTHLAVDQNQWYHFGGGKFTTHFFVYFSGWIGMFAGGTIWILTHGHFSGCSCSTRNGSPESGPRLSRSLSDPAKAKPLRWDAQKRRF